MGNKIIEIIAGMELCTCMLLIAASLIFMFAGVAAAAFRFMLGVL